MIHVRVGHPELLGVFISSKPWNQTLGLWELSLPAPQMSAFFFFFFSKKTYDNKLKSNKCKSTLENKRRLCTSSPQVLGSFRTRLWHPSKSSAVSPQFSTWLGWHSDWEPAFNSHAFPKSCFNTTGTGSRTTHVLCLGYSAVNVQSYKSVQHPLRLPLCCFGR